MRKKDLLAEHADEYQELQNQLRRLPLLAQGSVFAIEPPLDAPRASTHYKWTRKVRGKTVSVTLSREQYEVLNCAIIANRRVENTLKRMRQLSQDSIRTSLPDSSAIRAEQRSQTGLS